MLSNLAVAVLVFQAGTARAGLVAANAAPGAWVFRIASLCGLGAGWRDDGLTIVLSLIVFHIAAAAAATATDPFTGCFGGSGLFCLWCSGDAIACGMVGDTRLAGDIPAPSWADPPPLWLLLPPMLPLPLPTL